MASRKKAAPAPAESSAVAASSASADAAGGEVQSSAGEATLPEGEEFQTAFEGGDALEFSTPPAGSTEGETASAGAIDAAASASAAETGTVEGQASSGHEPAGVDTQPDADLVPAPVADLELIILLDASASLTEGVVGMILVFEERMKALGQAATALLDARVGLSSEEQVLLGERLQSVFDAMGPETQPVRDLAIFSGFVDREDLEERRAADLVRLVVRAKREGYRRLGRAWSAGEVLVHAGPDSAGILRADAQLIVRDASD